MTVAVPDIVLDASFTALVRAALAKRRPTTIALVKEVTFGVAPTGPFESVAFIGEASADPSKCQHPSPHVISGSPPKVRCGFCGAMLDSHPGE